MADVTGPISSLPGSEHAVPEGMTCDNCEAPATHRIQGETDSFGSEMMDLCDPCYSNVKLIRTIYEEKVGRCDWCNTAATDLRSHRDFEEGRYGPVYRVCGNCTREEAARCQQDLEESGYADSSADYGYDE